MTLTQEVSMEATQAVQGLSALVDWCRREIMEAERSVGKAGVGAEKIRSIERVAINSISNLNRIIDPNGFERQTGDINWTAAKPTSALDLDSILPIWKSIIEHLNKLYSLLEKLNRRGDIRLVDNILGWATEAQEQTEYWTMDHLGAARESQTQSGSTLVEGWGSPWQRMTNQVLQEALETLNESEDL